MTLAVSLRPLSQNLAVFLTLFSQQNRYLLKTRVGIKKPAQKKQKTHIGKLKKTTCKWFFLKGHSSLSRNLLFFPLKGH
jgi:hypothetical protein